MNDYMGGFGPYTYPLGYNLSLTPHQRRAWKALGILAKVCGWTGHFGECGMLLDRYRFPHLKMGERFLSIPNPCYRMRQYILRSAR